MHPETTELISQDRRKDTKTGRRRARVYDVIVECTYKREADSAACIKFSVAVGLRTKDSERCSWLAAGRESREISRQQCRRAVRVYLKNTTTRRYICSPALSQSAAFIAHGSGAPIKILRCARVPRPEREPSNARPTSTARQWAYYWF